MQARDLLEWLQTLTEEELDLMVYAGREEDGTYSEVNKIAICATQDPDNPKAIFFDTMTQEEYETWVRENQAELGESEDEDEPAVTPASQLASEELNTEDSNGGEE